MIPQKSSVSFLGGSKLMLSLCDVSRNGISVNSIPVGKNQVLFVPLLKKLSILILM